MPGGTISKGNGHKHGTGEKRAPQEWSRERVQLRNATDGSIRATTMFRTCGPKCSTLRHSFRCAVAAHHQPGSGAIDERGAIPTGVEPGQMSRAHSREPAAPRRRSIYSRPKRLGQKTQLAREGKPPPRYPSPD